MNMIRPVSDLRNHFVEISKTVYETAQPVFLTKNGYGDLVDVPADGGKDAGHLLDVGGVHLDDVAINRHLAEIGTDPLRLELGHLLLNEPLFLLCHPKLHLDIPFSICHAAPPPFP